MSFTYMRPNLPNEYGLLPVQDKILSLAVYLDRFCTQHGVEYCLMGGSALGAKRHGGFIPWDDDLDVFMTVPNYEKFRQAFKKEGDKNGYYLQEWGKTGDKVTTAKIRANGTTYVEENLKDWDMHHGVFIDIFILHNCSNHLLQQLWQCFWAKYAIIKSLAIRSRDRHGGFKGLLVKSAALLPEKFLLDFALRQVYRYENQPSDFYCNFLGKAVFKKGIYKKEWFDHPVYTPFETVQLKVPGKLHEFLSERFGNYMKVPSAGQIKWAQHALIWKTDQDFREMLPQVTTAFKDEEKLI